ncbi:putative oligopeptide transporter (OPT) family protein [Clavibacter michiganensis]|uniref:hypothetical protein n=1 Tax=Clavibacter michiganensis TaxID=28447 RepID=UPI00195EE6F1|nr:hypothetical protein [Clavibacter michiganensis]MBM7411979.1 putative oligopeptide transporter (OPT) family protein [Clavibacter michiganensis]
MADDTPDARSTGILLLVTGLVSCALLVAGVTSPASVPAAVFSVAVFEYMRVTGRRLERERV